MRLLLLNIIFLLFPYFINAQVNSIQNLIEQISENSEITNYKKIDSITISFLNLHPKVDEKEFLTYLNKLYDEDKLEKLAAYYFINGLFYENQAKYIAAIKMYLTAIEFVGASNSSNYLVYYKTAFCYERLGYSQEAIDYYIKSVSYPEIETKKLIEIYKNIGNCSIGLKKFDQSIEFYNKSYDAAKLIGDTITMIKTVINSGNTYLRAKNFKKAYEITNRAYNMAKDYNYYLGMAFAQLNLGLISIETKNFIAATENFKNAIQIAEKHDINYVRLNGNLYLAKSYLKREYYNKSLKAVNKYFELADNKTASARRLEALKIQSEVLINLGRFSAVNKSNTKLLDIVDSILSNNQKRYLENIESTKTMEKKLIENKLLSKELEINRLKVIESKKIIWLSVFGFILLLIIIAQLFYSRTKQNKYLNKILIKNKIIAEKNSEIFQQSEELMNSNEALLEYQEKLELKVKDRTKALDDALLHAKQQSELKSAFLKNISHEIRTPLNGILGFIQIISLNNPEFEKKYLKIIQKNTHDLTNTVDSIIELAEIETGGVKVHINEFSLQNFIDKINDNSVHIKQNLMKQDVELIINQTNITSDSNWVSDKNLLSKILYQLINNAFKYTEQGKVVINFNLDHSELLIKITDTGIGMDKKHLEKIFDSFLKLELKEKLYRGTGAGLSIVKNLSKMIDVEIDIQSELKKGTIVVLKLVK